MSPLDLSRTARPADAPAIDLLGVRVTSLNLDAAVARISDAIARGSKGYVCACGAHGLVDSQHMPELRAAYNGAFLVAPDGMPLVWELRRRGHRDAGRVYGPDLMLAMFARGYRHVLYGSTQETLDKLEARLRARYPQARIVDAISPPFRALSAVEEAAMVDRINAARADIVWVGLGAPKQEMWMARMHDRLDAPILVGVGAAFDFHAGNTRQAPGWMQRSGLEWLFRLGAEPRRLWRRYVRVVPGYLWLLALQRSGLRRFPDPGTNPHA
ncbi:WecB/TagA/CpsF family glycosyltransferase [Roseivivax isoporae]|uniref:Glycosyl transferase n=1 Tax=Roseivivax isoporae LMG 25204 TaxID=1449351 RepID=X7F9I7_9RHOB|nr:WecB/TagA/CpsF family glycosyltransferase [Roseivivax isoporae]ETX28754.1 glycosyl transferase [Roseivivax isoporae LMG 25204]